jgi:hypothetical protein
MANLNHVGKVIANGRRCLVAYKTLPGDAYECLIIPTESLQDSYHDALMKLVESNAAQSAFEFAEVLYRSTFPDGSNMLVSLHAKGHLVKVPTSSIEMIPNAVTSIKLSELNHLIAEQKGVSVQDLAIRPDEPSANIDEIAQVHDITPKEEAIKQNEHVLSDEELALKYRNDAQRLAAEADHLLKMAEELAPTKVELPSANVEEPTIVEPVVKPAPSTRRRTSKA